VEAPNAGLLRVPAQRAGLLRVGTGGPTPGAGTASVMITPLSPQAIGLQLAAVASAPPGNSGWPAANLAVYVPFTLDEQITVVKLFWSNGAAVAGNVDAGIYDEAGARLVSSGSTVAAGTSTIQEVDVTDTRVAPGRYYLALAASSTGQQFQRTQAGSTTLLRAFGLANQVAFPLPSSATFAACGYDYIPMLGVSLRSLV
jgi:hypothetical protein